MTRARSSAALAGIAAALAGCAQLKDLGVNTGEVLTQRGRENVEKIGGNVGSAVESGELTRSGTFSMEQEFFLGKTIAANVVSRLGGAALQPEHPAARYLRNVGTVLALAAAEQRRPEDRPYPLKGYRFILIDSPQVNAVGMPGGFVAVTTGAIRASRDEDELAAVVAHEIAHVQLGHAMSPVERAREQEHLTSTLLAGTDDLVHAFFSRAVTAGADFVLDKGYGKVHELEADAMAARVLAGAGYDPQALRRFLSRLQGKAAQGGFFSRHPPASERVAALAGGGEAATAEAGVHLRLARFEAATHALQ
jgi:predicted Zn-dependent protease